MSGEPTRDVSLSQYWTLDWLADRMCGWLPRGCRVLEPCAGSGALVRAMLRARVALEHIVAVEIDPRWADYTRSTISGLELYTGDFFTTPAEQFGVLGAAVLNPVFERNLHTRFVMRCLDLVPTVVCLVPVAFEFSQERHRTLWSRAVVTRRARLPVRVPYAGAGGKFETVALKIKRRTEPRRDDEITYVMEETWLPPTQGKNDYP